MYVARGRFFKNGHTLFAASDDDRSAAEMREEGAACFINGFFVVERLADVEAGFLGVADDGARAAIGVEARSFWFYEDGNFELVSGAENAIGEIVGDEAFIVVGENESVEFF